MTHEVAMSCNKRIDLRNPKGFANYNQFSMHRIPVWLILLFVCSAAWAQQISKDELVFLTPEWKGERFPDGRPKVPDAVLQRMRLVTLEEAWAVLKGENYKYQYEDGWHPRQPHLPHRLVCRNSRGETAEIIALIKTQGSDTKLVAQMQPYYEAKGLSRIALAGQVIPPIVSQIADGENGGVMMNEFPGKFMEVVREASGSDTPLMNGSEYLEHLFASGIKSSDLPVLQPVHQKKIWDRMQPGDGPEKLQSTIEDLRKEDHRFHMEGGSWTDHISWVDGYDNVLGPMEQVSALFARKILNAGVPTTDPRYRNALYHLMITQTSCFRYWGQGTWTDYARELCRRTEEILNHDFPE